MKEKLYRELKSGRYERVGNLIARRDEIRKATGMSVPRRPAEAVEWYDSKKSVLSRKLNPDNMDNEESEEEEEVENENEDNE